MSYVAPITQEQAMQRNWHSGEGHVFGGNSFDKTADYLQKLYFLNRAVKIKLGKRV